MAGLTGASAGHLGFCSKLGLSLPALGTSRELAVGWGWEEVREQGSVDDLLEKFGPEDTESGNRAMAGPSSPPPGGILAVARRREAQALCSPPGNGSPWNLLKAPSLFIHFLVTGPLAMRFPGTQIGK